VRFHIHYDYLIICFDVQAFVIVAEEELVEVAAVADQKEKEGS